MPTSTAHVGTSHASRYLQQLCKHWSHKFPVEFDATTGKVPFNERTNVTFSTTDSELLMTLDVDAAEDIGRMQNVITEHLKRFAFREELDVVWTATAGAV